MSSRNRLEAAAKRLEQIDDETDTELQELQEAIKTIEELHEEHVEELEDDEEFIEELKDLYVEIRDIRKIEEHLYNEIEQYGNGNIAKQRFKKLYVRDEDQLVEIISEVREDLEDMITILSEEERFTNKDLDIEGATEELVDALTEEEKQLEESHKQIEKRILG
ncbi:MAG: hypothetical protein ABEJ87_03005 [Candidatus Nanohalobium sp.]